MIVMNVLRECALYFQIFSIFSVRGCSNYFTEFFTTQRGVLYRELTIISHLLPRIFVKIVEFNRLQSCVSHFFPSLGLRKEFKFFLGPCIDVLDISSLKSFDVSFVITSLSLLSDFVKTPLSP